MTTRKDLEQPARGITPIIQSTKNAEQVLWAIAVGSSPLERSLGRVGLVTGLHKTCVQRVAQVFMNNSTLYSEVVSVPGGRYTGTLQPGLSFGFTEAGHAAYLEHLQLRIAQFNTALQLLGDQTPLAEVDYLNPGA